MIYETVSFQVMNITQHIGKCSRAITTLYFKVNIQKLQTNNVSFGIVFERHI